MFQRSCFSRGGGGRSSYFPPCALPNPGCPRYRLLVFSMADSLTHTKMFVPTHSGTLQKISVSPGRVFPNPGRLLAEFRKTSSLVTHHVVASVSVIGFNELHMTLCSSQAVTNSSSGSITEEYFRRKSTAQWCSCLNFFFETSVLWTRLCLVSETTIL